MKYHMIIISKCAHDYMNIITLVTIVVLNLDNFGEPDEPSTFNEHSKYICNSYK